MEYIIVRNDKMPGALNESLINTENLSVEEILKEVKETLKFQAECIEDPTIMEEFYGE